VRSGPGEARTILLLHIISVSPSKQTLMVRTFLKVYMELGSSFWFLQEQIKDIIIMKGHSVLSQLFGDLFNLEYSCLLVLNSVTSTPQWIRQPEAALFCVWCLRAWCVCVQVCARTFSGLSASEPPFMPPPAPWLSHFALCLPDLPRTPS
jgi:hypothetical protein